jgi:sugar phosphate isomerase/epimerase
MTAGGSVNAIYGADRFIVNTSSHAREWSVEACLKHLNEQGFHHFELTPHPGFLWPGDMDKTGYAHFRRFLAGHRLRIVSIDTANMGLDIASASADTRAVSLDLIERCIAMGGEIGAKGIVIDIGKADGRGSRSARQLSAYLYQALDRSYVAAQRSGVSVWVKNNPLAWEPTAGGLLGLLDAVGDDRFGVVYDVAAGWVLREDIGAALRAAAPRLKLVRLAGKESIQFQGLPLLLAEIGYGDWPVLEISADESEAELAARLGALLRAGFGELTSFAVRQE